jgi:hypothetical protein
MISWSLSVEFPILEYVLMTVLPSRRLAAGLAFAVCAAVAVPALAQGKEDKKLKDAQRKAGQVLAQVVDHAMATKVPVGSATFIVAKPGEKDAPAAQPEAIKLEWHHDAMRANDGKVYMPFTVTLEPGKVPAGPLAMTLRAVPRGSAPLSEDQRKGTPYPWEEFYFGEAKATGGGRASMTRAFQASGGLYDVYVAIRAFSPDQKKDQGPVTVAVLKQELDVPDYGTAGLTTSSVLLVGKVESLASPPTPEMQRERPYIMGPLELVPSVGGKFKKTEEFTFFFQVYNAQMENNKPDLTMEYAFYRQDGGAEKYFNKTNPQQFNAQTLPPGWDGSLGHVINGGQTIPLASFPEGEYRLEIKVTDNKATKSITRNVNFSVSGS